MTDCLQFAEHQILNYYDIGSKMFEIQCAPAVCRNAATSEQAMASQILKNKSYVLPSVECVEFKLKKAFQSGKILACTKKSEIFATCTLQLIKMMLKCQVAQASSTCMLY